MAQSIARVPTPLASRYLGQLCKHFEHKRPVEYSRDHGSISFDSGICTLDAMEETLILTADSPDPEQLERLQDVVAKHLIRFAFRDAPPIEWVKEAA
jgi:hypothetical protein